MTSSSTPAPVGRGEFAQLYVTTTHKVRDQVGRPPFDWVPYGVQHAWTAGSRKTLCGEWTTGWTIFWDRSFSTTHTQACPACAEASLPEASRRRLDPALRRTA